jgi:hypothetical protein
METLSRTTSPGMLSDETHVSAVSWAAVAAGAVATAALTLLLLTFGAGMGFSSVSPWSNSGVSTTTFKVGAGIYLIIVAVMASSIGGYIAGRLRTKWMGVHTHEVYFRDTAHGFLAWAFATVLSAAILGSAAAHIVSGGAQGLGVGGQSPGQSMNGPTDLFVDKLLRPGPGTAQSSPPATAGANVGNQAVRLEISRLFTASLRDRRDLTAADQTYVAQIVASRTGISQPEAEKRVADVIAEAKAAADEARKAAAHLSLWLTAAMLFGAFAASLAATEGGQLRDGTWSYDRAPVRQS